MRDIEMPKIIYQVPLFGEQILLHSVYPILSVIFLKQ